MKRVYFLFLLGWSALFSHEVAFRSPGGCGRQLFTPPSILSPEEISEGLKSRFLDASWIGDEASFRFVSTHNSIYFEAVLKDFLCVYGTNDRPPNAGEYLLHVPRILESPTVPLMTCQELREYLRKKHALWYTGAGVSLGSGVPAMQELNTLLGIEEGRGFEASVRSACLCKEGLAARISQFHRACFFSPPTQAHYAIKELTIARKEPLLTENLDYLHEYTGVMPLRIDVEKMRQEIDPVDLQEIDCIVCVGLSHDDRGFLGWYKMHNPQGVIVAIDLVQPSYLGKEDFLVQGDLQCVLSLLTTQVKTVE